MKGWIAGLGVAVALGQVGCSGSSKGSSSAGDAANNDTDANDADVSQDDGASPPASDGGTDATLATGNDAAADVTTESTNDGAVADASHDAAGDATLVDAAQVDAAQEAAAPWTPSSLTGLVLWLDGHAGLGMLDGGVDGGDGGAVVQWLDQSGHGNSALGYGSPSIAATALGGQPAVHFGGTDYLLVQDSPSLNWGKNDFVLAVVVQHTTFEDGGGSSYGTLYSKQIADTVPYQGVGLFANVPGGRSAILEQLNELTSTEVTSGGTGYNDGTPLLVVIHRAAIASDGGVDAGSDAGDAAPPAATASMSMLIDEADAGFASGVGYAEDVDSVGYPARIGGTQAEQNLTGDIAEIIAVEGAVSASDLSSLQAYLMSKYKL